MPDALYVRRLSVLPEFRGLGLGVKLIEACEAAAATRGLKFLEVHVRVALTGNRAFFAKLGFIETGGHRHDADLLHALRESIARLHQQLRPDRPDLGVALEIHPRRIDGSAGRELVRTAGHRPGRAEL